MNAPIPWTLDPELDLVLERNVDVPPELVWEAWTTPRHIEKWFCPAPWSVSHCEIDLRPGGIFRTVMRSPQGEETPNVGCYLEVVPGQRLVWTDALHPGYRPVLGSTSACLTMPMTAIITMAPHGTGTRYVATVLHADASGRKQHEDMGFHDGWGTALDQLVALMKDEAARR